MPIKKIKLPWIQKNNPIQITQGYHGRFQNNQAMDFGMQDLYAPTDGEVTLDRASGTARYFHFKLDSVKENAYIQCVHGKPMRVGKYKKGELLGVCTWHHWHLAINVNGSWYPLLDYIDQTKRFQLVGSPWSTPYNQWSFYKDRHLTVDSWPQPNPQPKPEPVFVYTVQAGDTLSEIVANHYKLNDWPKIKQKYTEIANINNISNPNLITVNQKIKLP
jgi:nucleoid-associated protein YgaU